MKKIKFIYVSLIVSILVLAANQITGQENTISLQSLEEEVLLVNDRDVYCADEILLFAAYNISSKPVSALELSKVLYVEIINPDGQAIAQEKFRFGNEISDGAIKIPASIQTGTYYIKAYTKWMRNYSPYSYFYKPIRLINPHSTELLQKATDNTSSFAILMNDSLSGDKDIEIRLKKQSYKKRKNVSVELVSSSTTELNISVSVLKQGLRYPNQSLQVNSHKQGFTREYAPETRGLSLSGKIIQATDSSMIPFNPVQLTLFTDRHEMFGVSADTSGQFNIALPDLEGKYELFISTNLTKDNQDPTILIDNDFCTKKIYLPFIPFLVNESEMETLTELCLNAQVSHKFDIEENSHPGGKTSPANTFYGDPDYIIKLADYIELPTLQDYIHELMPNIAIRQNNKLKYLKVLGMYSDLRVYDPLILLDMIPVKDVNRILAISPKNIDRVEIIGVPYMRGNQMYGGIVSFFSKEGDLAGIDLPDWGNFIKFKFYSYQRPPNLSPPEKKRVPDLRNTLYWNPSLTVNPGYSVEFNFTTADLSGNYLICIRGIDADGNSFVQSEKFKVK